MPILRTPQRHEAPARSRLQAVPGIGTIVRVVVLSVMHDIPCFPRVQDGVSSCRRVTCAKESVGNRSGTAGAQLGHAYLTWACAEAAVLLLRNHPMGQTYHTRLEHQHGKSKAGTLCAHQRARAVSDLLKRDTVCLCTRASMGPGAERVSRTPHGTIPGAAW